MRSTTDKPFAEALHELKDASGLTYRVLAPIRVGEARFKLEALEPDRAE